MPGGKKLQLTGKGGMGPGWVDHERNERRVMGKGGRTKTRITDPMVADEQAC